jgi:YD repeat-containing protein
MVWRAPDLTQPEATCPVADPVSPSSGSTIVTENDFVSGDEIPMLFSRTYRSRALVKPDSGFGSSWFHNWQRQLGLASVNSSTPQVIAYRDDGDAATFSKSAGTWRSVDGKRLSLSQGQSTWTLTDLTTGTIESYSAQGILLSVSLHGGNLITLTYSDANTPSNVAPSSGLLIAITEHAPMSLNSFWDVTVSLSYDVKWRITQMTDSIGGVTQYGYDENDNLTSVTWPDGNVRRYAYADPRFTSALTDIVDETGSRISTWTYDSQGRVTSVNHPDTTRNVGFAYDGSATQVSYGQKTLAMTFAPSGNMVRPTTTTSATGTASTTWDASGNLQSQTGVSGIDRSIVYDDAGRPTRVARKGLTGTTITSVRYADASSLRPSMIASPGRVRAFVYDAQSNLTGMSDWSTSDSTGESAFDALSDGIQQLSYGFAYDSSNQLSSAQVYQSGKLTGDWSLMRDLTGNLRQMTERFSKQAYRVTVRDHAHRPVVADDTGGSASYAYDARGRVISFSYSELGIGEHRLLKVTYAYSPDGQIVSRTGTVSLNNGAGAETPISSDEIDQWLVNWNSGSVPVGPPLNLLGWVQALQANSEPGLMPTLSPWEAFFAASRFAWTIYLISAEDPVTIVADKIKKCADIPPQLSAEEMSGILRDASSGKGNFSLGTSTAEDAQVLGEAWVGPGARETSDGSGMVSSDGLRVYRFPSEKPNSPYANTGVQANFESKMTPTARPYANGHLNISP